MRQRRPDWDKEQRERRAREHGRERAYLDRAAAKELDDLLAARRRDPKRRADLQAAQRAAEDDLFHRLIEPARQIAVGNTPKEEKPLLVQAAIEQAAAEAPTPELAARIRQWWPPMAGRRPSASA